MARNGSAEAAAGSPPLIPADSGAARLPPLPSQPSYTSSRQPYPYGYSLGDHQSFSSSSLPGSLGGPPLSQSHGAGSIPSLSDFGAAYGHLPGSPGLVSPATPSGLQLPLLSGSLKRPRSERPEEEADFSDDNGEYTTGGNQQQQRPQQPPQQQSNEPSDQDDEKGGNGRLLKQTKRAAQNRAAQQAFRKRKEERIKELEDKEKQLAGCLQREKEVVRREKEVYEREQRLIAMEQHVSHVAGGSSLPIHPHSNGHLLSAASPEDSKAFHLSSVAPDQHSMAEELRAARAEVAELQRLLVQKDATCASLNGTIEHMATQNRLLRETINIPDMQLADSIRDQDPRDGNLSMKN